MNEIYKLVYKIFVSNNSLQTMLSEHKLNLQFNKVNMYMPNRDFPVNVTQTSRKHNPSAISSREFHFYYSFLRWCINSFFFSFLWLLAHCGGFPFVLEKRKSRQLIALVTRWAYPVPRADCVSLSFIRNCSA